MSTKETQPIRISVVSYLNSKPFIYGLKQAVFSFPIEIHEDIPSVCAKKLITGNAEIGLIPVVVLPMVQNYQIISDYCIGALGKVNSVLLLSEVPLNEIESILLDYQSRTSVMLTRVLARDYWKINPEWKETTADYEKLITGNTAGVVIGDRALVLKEKFKFAYDLSFEWQNFTQLPFVFACWVSNKKLDSKFIEDFNAALKTGLEAIHIVSENEKSSLLSYDEIFNYLTLSIDFKFDDSKKEAMELFLKKAADLKLSVIPETPLHN